MISNELDKSQFDKRIIYNANTKLHLKKLSFSLWMGTDGPGHLLK